ncbi:MAG: C4-dicarboxylate-binding protein DctP [Alcanivorax sp.]|jgi:C4-dicarboxylate-binding protein DctP
MIESIGAVVGVAVTSILSAIPSGIIGAMRSKLKLRLLLTSFFAVILLAACGKSQESHLFRYGHSQSPASTRSTSMVYFAEQLQTRSNGRITVENYFSGVLGSEREMMDMVATGVLQGTRGGLFADANPKYSIFMLPFLVENWDQAERLVNSTLTDEINSAARVNGFHVPATGISQGFRAHTNNVRPIRTPADFTDLKMRVPPQEVYVLTAQVFGASPQEMPASEIYGALRTGVLDGQDNPPANIWDYHIFEVQKYMTVTHYSTGPDPFIVDLDWYTTLTDDLRKLFDEVARETMLYSDKLNRVAEQEIITKLETVLEVNYLTSEELQPFQVLAAGVHEHFVEQGRISKAEIQRARRIASGDEQ